MFSLRTITKNYDEPFIRWTSYKMILWMTSLIG